MSLEFHFTVGEPDEPITPSLERVEPGTWSVKPTPAGYILIGGPLMLRGYIGRDGLRRDGVPETTTLRAEVSTLKETVSHITRQRDGARAQVAALEKSFTEYKDQFKLAPNAQRYHKLRRHWVQIGYSDTQHRLASLDAAVDALPDQPST